MRDYGGPDASTQRVSAVLEIEAQKEREACQKAEDKKALLGAKSQGCEAVAAVKARIEEERATASQAKKLEKLRITAERKAEKARNVAEAKMRQAEKKVCKHFFLFDFIDYFPARRPSNKKQPHKLSKDLSRENSDMFCHLHSHPP